MPRKAAASSMVSSSQAAIKKPKQKVATSKKTSASNHPSYLDMILEGIREQNERKGSSRQALLKFIMAKYHLEDTKANKSRVNKALRDGVKSGALKQTKGQGASGSFRIGSAAKPTKRRRTVAKKQNTPKKRAAAKTTAAGPSAKKAKAN